MDATRIGRRGFLIGALLGVAAPASARAMDTDFFKDFYKGSGAPGRRPIDLESEPEFDLFTIPRRRVDRRQAEPGEARLSLVNMHTGEKLDVAFRRRGSYDQRALDAVTHIFRDWRQDEQLPVDIDLIEALAKIQREVEGKPLTLLSGFRTEATQELLRRQGGHPARNSLHKQAMAADICVQSVPTERLHRIARANCQGGVGFYPGNGFVHVDSGPERSWNG